MAGKPPPVRAPSQAAGGWDVVFDGVAWQEVSDPQPAKPAEIRPPVGHSPHKRPRSPNQLARDEERARDNTTRAVLRFVSMLREDNSRLREVAADALGNVARSDPTMVAQAGAIQALVPLLGRGGGGALRTKCCQATPAGSARETLAEVVANTLGILSQWPEYAKAVVDAGAVAAAVELIQPAEPGRDVQLQEAAIDLLSTLASHEQLAEAVVAAGALPKLLGTIESGSVGLRVAAAYAISCVTQMAAQVEPAVQAGAIGRLLAVVEEWLDGEASSSEASCDLVEKCTNGLSNIAETTEANAELVLAGGGLGLLLFLLRRGTESVQKAAAEAIGSLVHTTSHAVQAVAAGSLPMLLALMRSPNPDLKLVSASAIRTLSRYDVGAQAIVSEGGLALLLDVVQNWPPELQELAADILASIAMLENLQADLASAGAVQVLVHLLSGYPEALREVAAFALGELAQSAELVGSVVSAGAVPLFLSMVQAEDQLGQLAAAQALQAISQHPELNGNLNAAGAVPVLAQMLQSTNSEALRGCLQETLHAIAQHQAQVVADALDALAAAPSPDTDASAHYSSLGSESGSSSSCGN